MTRKLIILGALLLIAVGVHWLRSRPDPLDRFPHAFLAASGHDPAAVVVVMAPLADLPPPPEGLLPAWICDDPAFSDADGRPWLFPMALPAEGQPTPPRHPKTGRAPPLARCARYYTEEGRALLAGFAQGRTGR